MHNVVHHDYRLREGASILRGYDAGDHGDQRVRNSAVMPQIPSRTTNSNASLFNTYHIMKIMHDGVHRLLKLTSARGAVLNRSLFIHKAVEVEAFNPLIHLNEAKGTS